MKQSPNRVAFDNKKIRAKGKWFSSCYFENCFIITDEYSRFFDCYFENCKRYGKGDISLSTVNGKHQ